MGSYKRVPLKGSFPLRVRVRVPFRVPKASQGSLVRVLISLLFRVEGLACFRCRAPGMS